MINKRFFKTKDEVEVTFELAAADAQSVAIVADFLDWEATPMKKVVKTKTFKFKTRLPKDSQFEFRYLVNENQWVNDGQADSYIPNEYGEDNCLVSTTQV
ncbi:MULTISPECIES: isoamylase early set domain-containing protein [Vibrio]|uniref:1,4-alpha-glucan branching protein n=2 Tax=Vibrio TaxID=662 RepID=A0A1E5D6L0_9VIBR|nr:MULTISPECIES: isoamylase early set domain-containing protein [Vibrio]RBW64604.1 1,4-alpha-glucan branching protein [Vibrionales bacterium C3R12]MDN3697095.1 isoamylase early set domain-containing protein [Vibrio cortegadensis]NOH82263.1 1,4-alpha-glucan branching protein [Vibrio sp. 03-59-1]OEE79259.1 1,4-alpha-glucan branching protein [Vibrio genomosp. F6 str. FF-238]TKF21712.1 1,4-alpha-glucan branching protein [Vibrio genomosp. F6]